MPRPPAPEPREDEGTLDSIQRSHILDVLAQCRGKIEGPKGAAAVLGLKPSTLRYRMQKLGIRKDPDKEEAASAPPTG